MNVLMISDVYFPRVNGVSTSIQTFRRELTALGHEVDLISPAYPAPYAEDGHTLRVASRFVSLDPEGRMMKPRNVRALLRRLRERRYDLVHIQTPFVAHYLGIEIADALGVQAPMHVIPTGIPMAEFSTGNGDVFRIRHGIEKNRPMLLFVGYLDRRGALLDCYRAADAFVFASRTETQGLVLLEAMAPGVPVISTAVMGTPDIVGPKRGALVPEDNEADFARNIVKLSKVAIR